MSVEPGPCDTLVIGAGIVGLACALQLQQGGCKVAVVDDDTEGQAASWGNAGHIATEQIAPLASLAMLRAAPRRLFAFGGPLDLRRPWRLGGWIARYLAACAPSRHRAGTQSMRELLADAMPAWREFVTDLGAPDLLRESGHIVCWGSARAAEEGQAAWHAAELGSARIGPVDPGLSACLERALGNAPAAAIAFAGTGQISSHPRLRALARHHFSNGGGRFHRGRVTRLAATSARLHVELAEGRTLTPERVVVCAGIGSAALLAPLGLRVPLVAERGYHLHWAEHDWPDALPPVVFEDRSIIATRFSDGLRLAGFVEYAPADTPPDPRKWQALAGHALALGLPVRGTPQRWFGARPSLPDFLPAIGQVRNVPQVYYALGHQHLGLTLAPVTARLLAAQIQGGAPSIPLAAFDLARF